MGSCPERRTGPAGRSLRGRLRTEYCPAKRAGRWGVLHRDSSGGLHEQQGLLAGHSRRASRLPPEYGRSPAYHQAGSAWQPSASRPAASRDSAQPGRDWIRHHIPRTPSSADNHNYPNGDPVMSRMSPLSRSPLLEGTSGTKGTSLSASVFSVLLASPSRKEPKSGRGGVLDGPRLPAGLIQTSLAARQLNLLRTGLGGRALLRPFFN